MLQWASRISLASPSPAKTSIETHSLVGVRARYVQPFEDSALGGGVDILSTSLKGISHHWSEDTREEDIVLGAQIFADAAATILQKG